MLRNHLIIAWRSILKHKGFTAINIIGLSLSMSVCLLLILLVYDHYSYDTFHPKGDQTYRVLTYKNGSSGPFAPAYASSPLLLGQTLKDQYPFIEDVVNLNNGLRGEFRSEEKIIDFNEINGRSFFVSPSFFKAFGFELKTGNEETALNDPFSLVLSESLAQTLFVNQNPMGASIEIGDLGTFTVTGIVKDPPGKSHIKFNSIGSISTLPLLKNQNMFTEDYDAWENVYMSYNYLVIKEGHETAEVEAAINQIAKANQHLDVDHPGYRYELQSILDVVPGRLLSNELSFALPKIALMFFGMLGLIVIITASINYTNLSVALSLTRLKEVGIRKTNGATKSQIIGQFLIESIIVSFLSLLVAIGIYQILLNQFNTLWIFNTIGISLTDTWSAYLLFLSFSLLLGLISGFGPSLFISKIKVTGLLKGSTGLQSPVKGFSKYFSGKKILLGIQFSLSMIMLISIFLLQDQSSYLTSSEYGFDQHQVYYVELQGHDKEKIATEFSSISGVESVSFTSHHPATGRSFGADFKRADMTDPVSVNYFSADDQYIHVMGLELIAGSNFPTSVNNDNEKFIILNELAVKTLGFDSPEASIGEEVWIDEDTKAVQIAGVVKDYHWEPLMKSIEPLALRIIPNDYNFAYFRIEGPSAQIHSQMTNKWRAFDEAREYKGGYLDEAIGEFYLFMDDLAGILMYISLIAIAITSLGFLGMVSFHLKMRVKEIGIRKVLGAGFGSIALDMSKGFIVMLSVSMIFALPIAIIGNGLWINAMAVHSPISVFNVGPAVLLVTILASITVLGLVWKSASQNPTASLRSE